MFTWIFKPLFGVVALVGLAGCLALPVVSKRDTADRLGVRSIAVAGKSIVIAGPAGYCIDKNASRMRGKTAFVILGGCTIVSGDDHGEIPRHAGILTASVDQHSVSASDPAVLAQLAEFVLTETGRSVLARDRDASSVHVLGVLREKQTVLIHLRDDSPFEIPGIEATYWRGVFELNGRLITASVLGFKDQPLPAEQGLMTLRAFIARIRQETPSDRLVKIGVAKEPIL